MSSGPIEGHVKSDQVFRNKINTYIGKSFTIMSALQNGASVLMVGNMNLIKNWLLGSGAAPIYGFFPPALLFLLQWNKQHNCQDGLVGWGT